jgi:hypothetical protein
MAGERRTCTRFTRAANNNVLVLSPTAPGSGLSVQMTEMRALPERECCSMRVSLELRKGTWSLCVFGGGAGMLAAYSEHGGMEE